MIVPREEDRAKWSELNTQRAALESTLASAQAKSNPEFETWLRSQARHAISKPFASSQLIHLESADVNSEERHRGGSRWPDRACQATARRH